MDAPDLPPLAVVTGSSGLVGSALCTALAGDGVAVRRLVRREPEDSTEMRWDPLAERLDPAALRQATAVIHLAGENIGMRRFSRAQKQRIIESRVRSTAQLARALAEGQHTVETLLSASATGFYGDRGDELLDEDRPAGDGFLADVCRQWEQAAGPARRAGIRVVHLRLGIVVSPLGGALARMLVPFGLGLGGVLGSGQQVMSWVDLEDAVEAFVFALGHPTLSGPLNVAAPHPVTNQEWTATLGRVLHRPTALRLPAALARLLFGEMADELLLSGARVVSRKLQTAGFVFRYPELEGSFRHALNRPSPGDTRR